MRSHIGWRGERERSIPYKGVETSPKTVRLMAIPNGPKRTNGIRDTERCASEDAGPPSGVGL